MPFSLIDWERETPIFATEAAVIEDGQVLFIRRADIGGWAFPGGFVDPAESVAEAAIREVREETGLEVELVRLLGVYSRPRWRVADVHHVAFVARPIGGELTTSTETVDVRYFRPPEVPATLFPWYAPRIADASARDAAPVVRAQDVTWPSREELLERDTSLRADRLEGAMARWWQRWAEESRSGVLEAEAVRASRALQRPYTSVTPLG